MKRKIWICKLLALSVLMLCLSDFAIASDSGAYYSDNQNDRVVAFDPVEMSIRAVIPTKGTSPYPIGKANDKTSYVTTRGSFVCIWSCPRYRSRCGQQCALGDSVTADESRKLRR
jgi:hypothetical protein